MRLYAAAAVAALLYAAPVLAEAPVAYTVTPAPGVLTVEMRFAGDADGRTELRFPESFAGADGLFAQVSGVEVQGAAAAGEGAVRALTHAPGAPVVVRYRIRQDFEGALKFDGSSPFRAVTGADGFTAIGGTIFAEVDGRRNGPASFAWGSAPSGWTVASDLDHAAATPRRTADLLDAVLVGGGDLRMLERRVGPGRIRLAFHGDWSFDEAELADVLQKIAATSTAFWGDPGDEFLVAVSPLEAAPGQGVHAGLNLGDAFSLWLSPVADVAELTRILSHEQQHSWLPNRVGTTDEGLSDDPVDYWFSEGFTDFYTDRMLLRSGVWSLEDFVGSWNRMLLKYANSPVRSAPNARIQADFWNERPVTELAYQRGMLLAALWDDRLRRASGGARDLDDVVLAMRAAFRADLGQSGRPTAVQRLAQAYPAQGGGSLAADLQTYVEQGTPVRLPADLFGACARVVTQEVPSFARGHSVKNQIVGDVDPKGPAYAAGLRDGMRVIKREGGVTGDSRAEQVLRVDDGGTERVIRWRPAGTGTITLQEVVLAPGLDAEARAVCARRMAGA